MVTVTKKKSRRKTRIKYVGITDDARSLGVTRQHLYYVLEGKRISAPLVARYKALKGSNN